MFVAQIRSLVGSSTITATGAPRWQRQQSQRSTYTPAMPSSPSPSTVPPPSHSNTKTVEASDEPPKGQEMETDLGPNYEVSEFDVICGERGSKESYVQHQGNSKLKDTIQARLDLYKNSSKREKSCIIKGIIDAVHSEGGRFVMRKQDAWYDVGNSKARDKVSTAMRLMTGQKNRKRQASSSSLGSASMESNSSIDAKRLRTSAVDSSSSLQNPRVAVGKNRDAPAHAASASSMKRNEVTLVEALTQAESSPSSLRPKGKFHLSSVKNSNDEINNDDRSDQTTTSEEDE